MWKTKNGTIVCDKRIVRCDISTKVQSNAILLLPNVTMELSNMRKKNKKTTKCDKSTVICDIGIVQ